MILSTDRLLLREFVEDDWPAVLAYQSDPRYLRYYPWHMRGKSDVQEFVQTFIDWQREKPRRRYQFAVVLLQNKQLIGNCGIRMETAGAWEADIGYELAPQFWGCGYATEAARAVLAFGFDELELHRIWANCIADNIASARVLECLGMQIEGRMRENEWMKGRWWDTLIYAILEQEWRANR